MVRRGGIRRREDERQDRSQLWAQADLLGERDKERETAKGRHRQVVVIVNKFVAPLESVD